MENSTEKLQELLTEISKKSTDLRYVDYNESQITQEVILPILKLLDWDIENAKEVYPECTTISNKRIDFVLFNNDDEAPKVLLEAKKSNNELGEEVEVQLEGYFLDFSKEKDRKWKDIIGILTNGFIWKFYVLNEESERIVPVRELSIQNDSATDFRKILGKNEVVKGNAIEELRSLKRNSASADFKEIIEKGWSYLFSNDFIQQKLVRLINDEILDLNGFALAEDDVREFINGKLQDIVPTEIPYKTKFRGNLKIFTFKSIRRVIVRTSMGGELEYPSMKAAISDFVKDISIKNPSILEDYCNSKDNHGTKHKYITKSYEEATNTRSIAEANGWYVNVDLSKDQVIDYIWNPLCKKLGKKLSRSHGL